MYSRKVIDSISSEEFLSGCAGALLDVGPESLRVLKYPSGQPYLESDPGLAMSLSHSGNHWVCALSKSFDVGIDIQIHREFNPKLFERICTPTELSGLLDRSEQSFFELWTIKEAALKCLGTGLQFPMNKLDVCKDKRMVRVLEDRPIIKLRFNGSRNILKYDQIKMPDGTSAHVVWSQRSDEPRVHLLTL